MKRRTLECTLMILALLLSILSVSAFAVAPEKDKPALEMENVLINEFDSTYYNDGEIVINNFGIVYNNGGTVYNNGGTVYNNDGLVYNNGGIVYNNGAEVYNNEGTVYNNDEGLVHESQPVVAGDPSAPKEYRITMDADHSGHADFVGLEDQGDLVFAIAPNSSAQICPKPGLSLTEATTTAGSCAIHDDGTATLSNVDRDGTLTLKFALDTPTVSPEGGSYGDDQKITITAAEGARILYTLDNSSPLKNGEEYNGAFVLEDSAVLKVCAVMGTASSDVVEQIYIFPELKEPEFSSVKVGYEPVHPLPLIVINTGIDTVRIKSAALEGKDKNCFVLSSTKGADIPSGQKDETSWTIAPKDNLKPGTYKADIVLTLENGSLLTEDFSFTVKK